MADQKANVKKMTKTGAVREAMAALPRDAGRADVQKYVKEKFGLDITPDHITNIRSEFRSKAKKKKTTAKPPAPKATASAAKKPTPAAKATAAPGNGKVAVALDDVLAVKGLVGRLGAEAVRTLVTAFAK